MIDMKKIPKWVKISSTVTACVVLLGAGGLLFTKEYMKYNQPSKTTSVSEPERGNENPPKPSDNDGKSEDKKSIIVYRTKTGHKYHKDGCYHLKESKISITLEEAEKEGLEPCSHCHPK